MELLGHKAIQFLILWRTSKLFSRVLLPVHITQLDLIWVSKLIQWNFSIILKALQNDNYEKFHHKTPSCPVDWVIPEVKLWLLLHRISFTNMPQETFVPEQQRYSKTLTFIIVNKYVGDVYIRERQ